MTIHSGHYPTVLQFKTQSVKSRKESCIRVNTRELNGVSILQSQDLRVDQEKKPYIGFTQENSIENSVQDYLPYILKAHGLCPTTLVYPK